MSYSLVCVDMQPNFYASLDKKVQKACLQELDRAVQHKAAILLVEYDGYDPTIPELTDHVKKYRRVYRVIKNNDDGGREVVETIKRSHLPRLRVRVCGVNTGWCVKSTVSKLSILLPNSDIQVVGKACNCHTQAGHQAGLNAMRLLNNVRVL